MASLIVTLTESLILNNKDQGGTISKEITSIGSLYKRIVTVPNGVDTTLVVFKSTVGIGADAVMDINNVKYIRVTNLDGTNSVNLSLQIDPAEDNTAAADSCSILLEAGNSFMMGSPEDGIAVDDDAATLITALVDLQSIIIDSSSNDVDVEVFVAST